MMQNKSKLRASAVAALAVGAIVFGVTAPAHADPSGYKDLVGVGSDTTEGVMSGLATAIPAIGSYNATGTPQINVRSGGPTFDRPNGSSNGLRALSASVNPGGTYTFPFSGASATNITGQIDFARSSSAPSGAGDQLTFIPFATDAVSFAVNAASDFPRDIALGAASQDSISPAPFTLRNIYRGAVTTYADSEFQDVTIRPLIPQAGSGTRSFFVSALGLTDAQVAGVASAAIDVDGDGDLDSVQEHDGTFVVGKGDIVPFSVAQYISQANHSKLPTDVTERRGTIEIGAIDTVKPYIPASSGRGIVLNPEFSSSLTRLVFNVVATARLTGSSAQDVLLQETFVGTGSDVCENGAIIEAYGFGTIGDLCGNTTTYKQGYRLT